MRFGYGKQAIRDGSGGLPACRSPIPPAHRGRKPPRPKLSCPLVATPSRRWTSRLSAMPEEVNGLLRQGVRAPVRGAFPGTIHPRAVRIRPFFRPRISRDEVRARRPSGRALRPSPDFERTGKVREGIPAIRGPREGGVARLERYRHAQSGPPSAKDRPASQVSVSTARSRLKRVPAAIGGRPIPEHSQGFLQSGGPKKGAVTPRGERPYVEKRCRWTGSEAVIAQTALAVPGAHDSRSSIRSAR